MMKSSVKYESDTKVKVSVVVDAEELAASLQTTAKRLAKTVKVPGFRKGKAPMAVATKAIDPNTLQDQTIEDAISKAVAQSFMSNKLQALQRPTVSITKFVPDQILEFTAEAEILPEVKLGNYKKLKYKIEKVSVSDDDIDQVIERIRNGLADKKDVNQTAKNGDEVIIDFVGKKDGVAFSGGTGNDYPLLLGSKQFIPGFEAGIVGHKAGDNFNLDLKFPSDYGSAELKGAKVTFSVTLKTVKEVVVPELTDKLAAKAGPFKTVAELKADIKRGLLSQKERESDEKQKDDLITQLVLTSKVPVPEILVNDQITSIEQDFSNNLMYQGLSLEQYIENKGIKSKADWIDTEVRDAAVKRVKAGLVLAELSRTENLSVTEQEIEARVSDYKQQYGKNPEMLKQLDQPEVRRDIANRLLTEKTLDRLVLLCK